MPVSFAGFTYFLMIIYGPSTVELFVDDEKVGEMDILSTVSIAYTGHETFDTGRDGDMPVNPEYADRGKFKFTEGQLYKVVFDIQISAVDPSPGSFIPGTRLPLSHLRQGSDPGCNVH